MGMDFEMRIGRLLSTSYAIWQRETYAALQREGFEDLRPSYSPVFRCIDPAGTRIVDLAERAGMTKQSMTYLVRNMEKRGMVAIGPDPTDGRALRVTLTKRGQEASAALVEASMQLEALFSSKFGQDQIDRLRSILIDFVDWDVGGPEQR